MSDTQMTNEEKIATAMSLDPEEMRMLGVVEHKEEEVKPEEVTTEEVKAEAETVETKAETEKEAEVSINKNKENEKVVDNGVKETKAFSEIDFMKAEAEIKLFDKTLQTIEKDAAWYKEQYEETQDKKFADKYNEKATEYNAVIKERTEVVSVMEDHKVKEGAKSILAEYCGEMGKDGKVMVEFVTKALHNPPPYIKDAFTLSERIWAKALRLKEAAEIARKSEQITEEKEKKTTEAKQVLKQVANNTGTGTGNTDTTNWTEVSKQARSGNKEAMRKLMHRGDPILDAMRR